MRLRRVEDLRGQLAVLVADLVEHRGAVNQVTVAQDCSLFATCSDDSTVKIWDSSKLARSLSSRSRLTYNRQGLIRGTDETHEPFCLQGFRRWPHHRLNVL